MKTTYDKSTSLAAHALDSIYLQKHEYYNEASGVEYNTITDAFFSQQLDILA